MSAFIDELRRRHVLRMAAFYAVGSWAALQIVDLLVGLFGLADGTLRVVGLLLLAGFPVAMVFSWYFELTPEGIRRESAAQEAEAASVSSGRLNLTLIGVLVLGLAVLLIDRFLFSEERMADLVAEQTAAVEPTLAPLPREGIAILPFDNLSEDQGNAYFAAGVHEEVLTQLSRLPGLKVTSRTSVLRLDNDLSIPEIGARLGVALVLEGSVRRIGDQVRVTTQLIDSRTDEHVWAENFDETVDNVFEVQDRIAEAIARQLRLEDGVEEFLADDAPSTVSAEAYQNYLQALALLAPDPERDWGVREEDGLQALRLLTQAVEWDPNFAEAWAMIARNIWYLKPDYEDSEAGLQQFFEDQRDAAERAVTLAPNLPLAHLAMASLGNAHSDDRRFHLEEAVRLDPNNAEALAGAADSALRQGRTEDAIRFNERALAVDPLNPGVHGTYGALMIFAGQLSQAEAHARRFEELSGEFSLDIEKVRLEQNDLAGYLERLHERLLALPSANQSLYLAEQALTIDPSGALSDRWSDAAEQLPDGNTSYDTAIRIGTELRRGAFDRALELAEPFWAQRPESGDAPAVMPQQLGLLERYKDRWLWDDGDQEGFRERRQPIFDALWSWMDSSLRRGGELQPAGYRDLDRLIALALVATSLGETAAAAEAIEAIDAFHAAGRFHYGGQRDTNLHLALVSLFSGETEQALDDYEAAFLHGYDVEKALRVRDLYLFADEEMARFFDEPDFQALLARSREHRSRQLQRLEARAPQVMTPDVADLMDRIRREWPESLKQRFPLPAEG